MLECEEIQWDDVYLLGDSTVDAEHKKLFELTKQLATFKHDRQKVLGAIEVLMKYTKFHFAHEEKFMESINYPHLEEHKKVHQEIVKSLSEKLKEMGSLSTEEFVKELSLFVKQNIVHHILTEDKRMQHFTLNNTQLKLLFKWKDLYKIDLFDLDSEHKALFKIAIKALEMPEKNRKEHVREVLVELAEYMKIHFKHEEKYMRLIDYADYDRHKKLHDDVIIQMNDFIKQLPLLPLEVFERKLIEYIDIWLISHILEEDKKIACKKEKARLSK